MPQTDIGRTKPIETQPVTAINGLPQRWWLLALLFTAMLISYAHRGAFSVAAPFMANELHLSKASIGIILSSFFWIYALMQLPAGWVVDRFGTRRAYSLGFVFWSIATALEGLARGAASLVGLRVAMGAGQSITFEEKRVRKLFIIVGLSIGCLIIPAGLVANKMIAVWLLTISLGGLGICSPNTWTLTQAVCEKKIVGIVTGIQNFGGNIGGILAPAVTGYIAHVSNSFALAFALAGAILIVGILAYWFLITDEVQMR